MTRADKVLCWIYAAIAVAALVGTQWALVDILSESPSWSALTDGPIATFITIDLLALALVATIFMVVEGRRLKLRRLWVYIVLTFAVAASVALPLFLIARTRNLAAARTTAA